jgi:hypothetical protein
MKVLKHSNKSGQVHKGSTAPAKAAAAAVTSVLLQEGLHACL